MSKKFRIYNSFAESKEAEYDNKSNLSYYNRIKNAMDLIRKVYAKQILENKRSNRIILINRKKEI
jgi:hypothetical protein